MRSWRSWRHVCPRRAQRNCANWNVANRVIFDEDPRAQTDCANWNSLSFFATAGAADVRACLWAGADPGARENDGLTPFDVLVEELNGTPVHRRLRDARRI